MLFSKDIGIIGYGTYLPPQRISSEEVEQRQGKSGQGIAKSLGIISKTVPGEDEDAITMAIEAGLDCFARFPKLDKQQVGALFVGSESHPYAVKPSGTVIASALGLPETLAMADFQFACKAGVQAMLAAIAYVGSGMAELGMGIGSDTAQAKPGNMLEFSAAAGAACFVVSTQNLVAKFLGAVSIATDTPDFWRRPGFAHPEHAGRFTGGPAYFAHVQKSSTLLLEELHKTPKDFTYCVFHTPNAKFPKIIATQLGFTKTQLKHSLIVEHIGNTYAAATLLALANVLDHAKKGDEIFVASYGSGAGSDAIALKVLKNGKLS